MDAVWGFLTHRLTLLLVGGALGTWARYGISEWFRAYDWAHRFPWATFLINATGSFLLAVAYQLIRVRMPAESWKWFLLFGTGFCGGYTTFSTFELDVFELALLKKQPLLALAYAFGSVLAGF